MASPLRRTLPIYLCLLGAPLALAHAQPVAPVAGPGAHGALLQAPADSAAHPALPEALRYPAASGSTVMGVATDLLERFPCCSTPDVPSSVPPGSAPTPSA